MAREPRAVTVHGPEDALAAAAAAAELGRPVRLLSAPGAAAYAGAGWFAALVRLARERHPDALIAATLDCGDRPELVQGALRTGLDDLIYTGSAAIAARLADIAGQRGARLRRRRPRSLDLADVADTLTACRSWLARD
jgi:hypothetical protein